MLWALLCCGLTRSLPLLLHRAYLQDIWRLDRPRAVRMTTNESSWNNEKTRLLQFLGFVFTHCPLARPTLGLACYRDVFRDGFMCFMRFLADRQLQGANHASHCLTAKRVLVWLCARAADRGTPYTEEQQRQHSQHLTILDNLSTTMPLALPRERADAGTWMEENGWMDAVEVVHFVMQLKASAERAIEEVDQQMAGGEPGGMPDGEVMFRAVRAVHDAVLGAFNFGYFPPLRPSCIVSMRHPEAVAIRPGCQRLGCRRAACQGNRLHRREDGGFRVCLPHHKNAER
jgi:hypothetical protein